MDPSFGPLEAIRLSIQTDSPVWIILSEVSQALSPEPGAPRRHPPHGFSLIPALSPCRFLSKKRSDTGTRKGGHAWIPGPAPSPPAPSSPRRLARAQRQPCRRGTGPAARRRHRPTGLGKGAARTAPPSPAGAAGPGRCLLRKKSKKQNPLCHAEGWLRSPPQQGLGASLSPSQLHGCRARPCLTQWTVLGSG